MTEHPFPTRTVIRDTAEGTRVDIVDLTNDEYLSIVKALRQNPILKALVERLRVEVLEFMKEIERLKTDMFDLESDYMEAVNQE